MQYSQLIWMRNDERQLIATLLSTRIFIISQQQSAVKEHSASFVASIYTLIWKTIGTVDHHILRKYTCSYSKILFGVIRVISNILGGMLFKFFLDGIITFAL